ncbi:MAG: hypothetical protein IPQ17_07215 [Xanthomonadales bacterium]|nr:hypothetical protein [Xanthomonadales bacterium]
MHNTAADWFYMNIPDGNGTPAGSSLEGLVASTLAAGSQPLLTLSTIGWIPKPVQQKRWGFSVAKLARSWSRNAVTSAHRHRAGAPPMPAMGATILHRTRPDSATRRATSSATIRSTPRIFRPRKPGPTGWRICGSDLARRPMAECATTRWTSHVVELDHRDVHPAPLTYDEIWQRTVTYASAIKAQDPAAKILGPVTWGYCDLFGSAADNCLDGDDRAARRHSVRAVVPAASVQLPGSARRASGRLP